MPHREPVFSWSHLLPLVLLLAAPGCAHRGVPAAYPAFDPDMARPSLVVAEFVATGDLPEFEECKDPEVLCMDPAPTWIQARSLQVIHGEGPGKTFFASTTSHHGRIDAYGRPRTPMLMLLLTHQGSIVMQRYARAQLQADASGRWHLVLTDAGPHWLPCSIVGLREPVTDPVLARAGAVTREHYEQFFADDRSGYFRLEGDTAYPRYSLPMASLQAHLAGKTLAAADFRCER